MAKRPQFNVDLILEDAYKRGWDQRRLSERAHVKQTTLSRILNRAGSSGRITTIAKLADALGYPTSRYVISPSVPEALVNTE